VHTDDFAVDGNPGIDHDQETQFARIGAGL
jgi:hypothetical protein